MEPSQNRTLVTMVTICMPPLLKLTNSSISQALDIVSLRKMFLYPYLQGKRLQKWYITTCTGHTVAMATIWNRHYHNLYIGICAYLSHRTLYQINKVSMPTCLWSGLTWNGTVYFALGILLSWPLHHVAVTGHYRPPYIRQPKWHQRIRGAFNNMFLSNKIKNITYQYQENKVSMDISIWSRTIIITFV